MASRLVTKAEICKALNYSAKEIDDLVSRRQIGHVTGIEREDYTDKLGRAKFRWKKKPGNILFPLEEILARFSPRAKAPPEPEKTEPF